MALPDASDPRITAKLEAEYLKAIEEKYRLQGHNERNAKDRAEKQLSEEKKAMNPSGESGRHWGGGEFANRHLAHRVLTQHSSNEQAAINIGKHPNTDTEYHRQANKYGTYAGMGDKAARDYIEKLRDLVNDEQHASKPSAPSKPDASKPVEPPPTPPAPQSPAAAAPSKPAEPPEPPPPPPPPRGASGQAEPSPSKPTEPAASAAPSKPAEPSKPREPAAAAPSASPPAPSKPAEPVKPSAPAAPTAPPAASPQPPAMAPKADATPKPGSPPPGAPGPGQANLEQIKKNLDDAFSRRDADSLKNLAAAAKTGVMADHNGHELRLSKEQRDYINVRIKQEYKEQQEREKAEGKSRDGDTWARMDRMAQEAYARTMLSSGEYQSRQMERDAAEKRQSAFAATLKTVAEEPEPPQSRGQGQSNEQAGSPGKVTPNGAAQTGAISFRAGEDGKQHAALTFQGPDGKAHMIDLGAIKSLAIEANGVKIATDKGATITFSAKGVSVEGIDAPAQTPGMQSQTAGKGR